PADVRRLAPLADLMVQQFPTRTEAQYYRATALYLGGKNQDAIIAARHVVDAVPGHTRAQGLLGAACAAAGQRDCARAAFEAAVSGNPRDPSAYVNAGAFHLQSGNPSEAERYFASAL